MAKISLRAYNREIEEMIDSGQLEEAIAHCHHILKTYSMHIETYRLLGKAFLEGRRYADAADVFLRVLNAVPDDFVAHVGMSIIRYDERKLDEAIWHMERAFQIQPSNPAIQEELRRLYKERDNIEPPRIRLTRDALANMYEQGELYNQAIAEARAILADDPHRPDLQVMLARCYLRSGHRVEAAEVAAQLLKKYPYCLDALRVLVEVLPGTGRAEDTQAYRQRLRLLDPYSLYVTDSVFESHKVADAAVSLDRLEYQAGVSAAESQPTWAASLGVQLDETPSLPAWSQAGEEPAVSVASPPAPELTPEEEEIPDFLRAAGWKPFSRVSSSEEPPAEEQESLAEEGLVQAQMPDWLQAIAPPALGERSSEEVSVEPDADFASLLADFPNTKADDAFEAPAPKSAEPSIPSAEEVSIGEDTLAWLKSLETTPEAESRPLREQEELPDWLKWEEAPTSQAETVVEKWPAESSLPEESLLEWPAPLGAEEGEAQLQSESQSFAEDVLPDWLKETAESELPTAQPSAIPEAPEPAKVSPTPETESTPAVAAPLRPTAVEEGARPLEIGDDVLAWLESLAARQGAKSEELLTRPEERQVEAPPPWVPSLDVAAEPAKRDETKPTLPEAEAGEAFVEQKVSESRPSSALGVESVPPEVPFVPAWEAREEVVQETAGAEGELSPGFVSEEILFQAEMEPSQFPFGEMAMPSKEQRPTFGETEEDIIAWLKQLEQAEATSEDVQTTTVKEELPAWLTGLEEEPVPPTPEAEPWRPEQEPVSTSATFPSEEPGWFAEEAEEQVSTGFQEWIPQAPEEEPATPAVKAEAWIPEQEPVPTTFASEEPDWFAGEAEDQMPTGFQEWIPEIAGEEPATPAVQEEPKQPVVSTPRLPKPTGILSPIPSQEKEAVFLERAQAALDARRLDDAMREYGKLIKKGKLLDEVIHDLREAIYRFPVDVIIWQTLGDAYMRAGRLQDALDAYTKAEELLR